MLRSVREKWCGGGSGQAACTGECPGGRLIQARSVAANSSAGDGTQPEPTTASQSQRRRRANSDHRHGATPAAAAAAAAAAPVSSWCFFRISLVLVLVPKEGKKGGFNKEQGVYTSLALVCLLVCLPT